MNLRAVTESLFHKQRHENGKIVVHLKLVIFLLLAVSFVLHTQTTTELQEEEKKNEVNEIKSQSVSFGFFFVLSGFLCLFPMHMDQIE